MANQREQWGSNWGFLMAAIGSAIGLGNIWKFSYVTGMNGGGAFVLVYLICIALIGLPVMICEISMGRAAQRNPLGAFLALAPRRSKVADAIGGFFILLGILLIAFRSYGYGAMMIAVGAVTMRYGWAVPGVVSGVIGIFLISGVYSVVGGWTLAYALKAFLGELNFTTEEGSLATFNSLLFGGSTGGLKLALCGQIAFVVVSSLVVIGGVRAGIERWSKILMPVLFSLLLVLILRGLTLPGALSGVRFFLSPDFSKLSAEGVLEALGMAFYSLSLGMGIMITYGSYMNTRQSIVKNSLAIIGFDTLAAIMGGLAIFPAVFAMGFRPDSGTGLVFKILPAAFNQIPGGMGWLWSGLFFSILSIAAITSGVSLIEVSTSVFMDQWKLRRRWAVLVSAVPIALIGIFCAISVENWERIPSLEAAQIWVFGSAPSSLFVTIDAFTTNWVLPVSGMLSAIFVGWVWGTRHALREIRKSGGDMIDTNLIVLLSGLRGEPGYGNNPHRIFTAATCWGIFVRFIAPIGILLAFLHSIGVI